MCGIVGVFGSDFDNNKLSDMLDIQKHRGPDYTGIWSGENCSLGHNRFCLLYTSDAADE